jgi:hypothetical protein
MKSSLLLAAGALMFMTANAANPSAAPNLHDLMKNVVAIQAQVIWDVGNQAQDDQGNPDASKLKAADWTRIVNAGGKVKQAAQALGQVEHVMAAAPGQKLEGEGNPGTFGAKQVQSAIDANPKVFRAFAQALSVSMDQIVAAAQAKDAAKVFDVSGRLDQVCEDCHVQFWYPEQKTPR